MRVISQFNSNGNIEILSQRVIALFASREAPQSIVEDATIFFKKLCAAPVAIAGAWHAPLEKSLLKNTDPKMAANIIMYNAHEIKPVKENSNLEQLKTQNKLLLISQSHTSRASKTEVRKRDQLIFKHAHHIVFLYIRQGGRLEEYFTTLYSAGYPVSVLNNTVNQPFLVSDTVVVDSENIDDFRRLVL